MKKVGIVGCGVIGSTIAKYIDEKKINAMLVSIYDINPEKTTNLYKELNEKPKVSENIDDVFKTCDLVIESAHPNVVRDMLEKAMEYSKEIFIMSIGGLLIHDDIYQKAKSMGIKVYYPSGAIAGTDGISSASIGTIKKLTLITKKPPEAFVDVPYLKERNINPFECEEETRIFKGSVHEVIKYFPTSLNVAASLVLCGVDPEKITVKILTSKKIKKNIHIIKLQGEFGEMRTMAKNVPSEDNPKTSKLAVFSAIAKLKEILS